MTRALLANVMSHDQAKTGKLLIKSPNFFLARQRRARQMSNQMSFKNS
jgi:hypothetical protein